MMVYLVLVATNLWSQYLVSFGRSQATNPSL